MGPLRLLAPPERTHLLLIWQPTNDKDLRHIRDEMRDFLAAQQPGHDNVAERMGLVVTELAGNALRHGSPPVTVRLLRDSECYVLDVSDSAVDRPPTVTETQSALPVGGRGLWISQSMAEQVCWYSTATVKHVWASFPGRPQ